MTPLEFKSTCNLYASKQLLAEKQHQRLDKELNELYATQKKEKRTKNGYRAAAWICALITFIVVAAPVHNTVYRTENSMTIPGPVLLHMLIDCGAAILTLTFCVFYAEYNKRYQSCNNDIRQKLHEIDCNKFEIDKYKTFLDLFKRAPYANAK